MKDIVIIMVAIYLLAMNSIAFVLMGMDKLRAIKKGWRIPERTLLLIAFIGGVFGIFFGMIIFHHKIRNKKFQLLVPMAIFLYLILAWYLT